MHEIHEQTRKGFLKNVSTDWCRALTFVLALILLAFVPPHSTALARGAPGEGPAWTFTERSAAVGLAYDHWFDREVYDSEHHEIGGGLAIGDINGDGWDDIFAVTGAPPPGPNDNPNKLFMSNQDGTYTESALTWGLSSGDIMSAGPLIADLNGDGFNDLLVGGVVSGSKGGPNHIRVYAHNGASAFTDVTISSNLFSLLDTSWNFGMAAGDADRDGDLDLFVTHWLDVGKPRFLENDGNGVFTDISATRMTGDTAEMMFTPTFADINGDGWSDLMLSSDFLNASSQGGGSRYYINDGTGFMLQQDQAPLTDENGMGGALGDYDNDGDLDWFTSSIFDPDGKAEANWGVSGNRLYNNDGSGNWTDVTDTAGVREGYWGWGACWGDFNNDMHLDLYHVNGFFSEDTGEDEFVDDPAVMFVNDGDGTFTEMGSALGVDDTGQGRAILCFDNDRDGDLDILVNNALGPARFFKNNLDNGNNWIEIRLVQPLPNRSAIGAVIRVTAGGVTQMRQVMAGGNYGSSHPTAQHFGLAENTAVSSIEITWPDGTAEVIAGTHANQYLVITRGDMLLKSSFESG